MECFNFLPKVIEELVISYKIELEKIPQYEEADKVKYMNRIYYIREYGHYSSPMFKKIMKELKKNHSVFILKRTVPKHFTKMEKKDFVNKMKIEYTVVSDHNDHEQAKATITTYKYGKKMIDQTAVIVRTYEGHNPIRIFYENMEKLHIDIIEFLASATCRPRSRYPYNHTYRV